MKIRKATLPFICILILTGINSTTGQNDSTKAWVMIEGTFQHITVDTPATIKDGYKTFYNKFYEVLRYPKKARANGDQGEVIYSYEVTKEGMIENLNLVQSASHELDSAVQAALIVIAKDTLYKPAKLEGNPIRSKVEFPVLFQLQ